MGDGTQENPFTRDDVLKLIEENGGRIIQDPKYWEEVFFQSDAVICDMDITSVKIIEK